MMKYRFACVQWSHRQRKLDCSVTMTSESEGAREWSIARFLKGPFDAMGVPSDEHRFARFEQ